MFLGREMSTGLRGETESDIIVAICFRLLPAGTV